MLLPHLPQCLHQIHVGITIIIVFILIYFDIRIGLLSSSFRTDPLVQRFLLVIRSISDNVDGIILIFCSEFSIRFIGVYILTPDGVYTYFDRKLTLPIFILFSLGLLQICQVFYDSEDMEEASDPSLFS